MNKKLATLKKKLSLLKISRFIVQLISLYFFSGLFTLAFTGFRSIYLGLARENFSIANSFTFLIAFAAVVILSLLIGRFFCGWLCAFGTFNDLVYLVSRKVFKKKIRISPAVDEKLKYIKYIVLFGIIIFMWSMNLSPERSIDPWDAFAQLPQFKTMVPEIPIAFIVLALITIGAIFIERFFCRYLCPLGAIQAILSKFKIISIYKPSEHCGKCQMCTRNCPMGINLSKVEVVESGECIACFKCVDTCHRSNPSVVVFKKLNLKWYYSSAIAIIIFSFVLWGSKFVKPESKIGSKISSAQISKVDETIFNDGVYTGVGTGFRPNLKVEIKISKGRISDIQIVSHEETKGYYEQAFDVVPKEIIAAQSTDVDTVSGATKSSNGIKAAVQDALNKARKDKSKNQVVDNNQSQENSGAAQAESTSVDVSMDKNAKFKDGTYTGVGTGYQPGLKVSVTIKDGKIADIQILSNNETPGFREKAFSIVPKEIIAAQSTSVDAVSGATFSSRGIMAAVKNALQKALISGELPVDQTTPAASTAANNSSVDVSNVVANLPVYNGKGLYKDGVYTGTGRGFQPNLKVSVTVKDGKITEIKILSHNETPGFYEKAFSIVPKEIVSKQATDVDTVSGATRSSNGIIAAVSDALKNARVDGTTIVNNNANNNANNGTSNNSSNNSNNGTNSNGVSSTTPADTNKRLYKNGVYTGMGTGFQPGLAVSVTVTDNKISDIKILSHNETSGFYEEPFDKVPKEIIAAQSTSVDTVSGATRSSNGIIAAVNDALKNAKIDDVSGGNTTPTNTSNNNNPTESGDNKPVATAARLYKDGRYTGIGTGLKNNLTVDVTLKDNKITNINLITYKEGVEYMKKAMTPMSDKIIAAQSTEVDVVSGATETSNGIKDAVNKALEKAIYKDGTYSGFGRGYNRNQLINVNVTVKDGKISSVDLTSQSETASYFEKAWPIVPDAIVKAQSTSVDTVSGATKSSKGIISAVKAALSAGTSVGETSTYPSQEDVVAPFRDGVYTGKGKGYKPDLTVMVTIKDNKIIKIDLGPNDETPGYFKNVWPLLPNQMIAKQSADVDAVSGATRSTNGVINAVKDALRQSKLALTAEPVAPYKDGTYSGAAKGYKDGLNVNVTVKDNKIEKIDLGDNNETPSYFKKAWPIVPEAIIKDQKLNVDTVSGATRSSNGIMAAVKDALRKSHDATLNLGDTNL
ncbi:hypothetical protein CPJCM30710_11140 [Clostridium polyendosporum]|uniref:4Fe-4S ferredoxin-type domain-containing protein n=1 Tax=Clostridium polyendosporum TaxID=69208 RepID=A0A919S0N3_9CLOT|nr:FMN-binding protein [Clostridium polyendosporum]GIM28448.1 hypothetical protein CPJCM30710_11140 [Clostridium polyendosporum]